jgi:hypothetical protein
MTDSFLTPEERLAALNELEKRQRQIQKRAVQAAWGSIIIAMSVLAALIIAIFSLFQEKRQLETDKVHLQTQKQQLEADIDDKSHQVGEKREELALLNQELAQSREQFAAVRQKLGTGNIAEAKRLAIEDEGSSKVTPRIYIHIPSKNQLQIAHQLAQQFRSKGYSVPKAEILVDQRLGRTEVRYFHQTENEHEEATSLARDIGGGALAKYIGGYENSRLVKPRQFEVWLASGS